MAVRKRRPQSKKKGTVSAAKAKTILKDGSVRGHPLTPSQKRFFGARAGGAPVKSKSRKRGKAKRNRKSESGYY